MTTIRTTEALAEIIDSNSFSTKMVFENIFRVLPKYELSVVVRALTSDLLSSIKMSQCKFQLDSKEFCAAVSCTRSLKILELTLNRLSGQSVVNLSEIIAKNTSLETLNLNSNVLNDDDLAILSASLKTNKTLIKLQLNGNNFGDKGVDALIKALETNGTLREIELDEHLFAREKVEKLKNLLNKNGGYHVEGFAQIKFKN